MKSDIVKAAETLKGSKHSIAFTGAGISVESGIPPFRGEKGIYSKYNPDLFDLDCFYKNPLASWQVMKKIFFELFNIAEANDAHIALAEMEQKGILKALITQNIDNLHQRAGSKTVLEFHGNSRTLVCTECPMQYPVEMISLDTLPPVCEDCGKPLKPDFVFFGEGIPEPAATLSFQHARMADVVLIVGSTGEVYPAADIPRLAARNGAIIIEVNTEPTLFTDSITGIFLQGKATDIFRQLMKAV